MFTTKRVHTPGPWLARTTHFSSSGVGTPCISHGDTASIMCWLNLSGAYGGNIGIERAQADARLAAAAPDLLDSVIALKAELDNLKWGQKFPGRPHVVMDLAEAAIAKAVGVK